MADPTPTNALTPNYSFNQPTVGGDDNVWGGLLNDNWASIDTILWTVSGVASAALTQGAGDGRYLQLTGGTLGPNSFIVNGPTQFNNYAAFSGAQPTVFQTQAQFTGGATFGTAQVFFNSPVTFSSTTLAQSPPASDNSQQVPTTAWVNAAVSGAIGVLPVPPAASNAAPAMNGVAAPGSSALYSRGDHVHPSDTTRLALSGGAMTGLLALSGDPTANLGAATKQYVDSGDLGGGPGGFVNKLRNGTFDVWQRGTSGFTLALGGWASTADGWMVYATGALPTVTQTARNSMSAPLFGLGIAGAAGNTGNVVSQRIESFVAAPLDGHPITVQFSVANATGATITPQLQVGHLATADNAASVVVDLPYTNLQPCPNGVATKVAYTFTLPAGAATGGLIVYLQFPALTAAQSVGITAADLRATPGVPVGLNANPPPPELRPIAVERVFCERYFWNSANGGAGPSLQIGGAVTAAGAFTSQSVKLPQTMRAVPTVAFGVVGAANASSLTVSAVAGANSVTTSYTAAGAGNSWITFNLTANAEL